MHLELNQYIAKNLNDTTYVVLAITVWFLPVFTYVLCSVNVPKLICY